MKKMTHLLLACVKWAKHLIVLFFKKVHSKKRRALPFYFVLGYFLLVILFMKYAGETTLQSTPRPKSVKDVTQLVHVQAGEVVTPKTVEEIVQAIQTSKGPISIGGGRYSMGGQVIYPNSLHIDMRQFDQVLEVDRTSKRVTVESGITWRKLQNAIDHLNLSVKIMQTYADFTVGGSVSVNCHGRYIGHGPIASSVVQLELVLADGSVVTTSRTENPELFRAAIGGYGGIGVITHVTLDLEDNVKVKRRVNKVSASEYLSFFESNIKDNDSVIFQNGDLYPPHFDEVNNVSWRITSDELTSVVRVNPKNEQYWLEPKLVNFVAGSDFGKWCRPNLLDPLYYLGDKVVYRNNEASYDVNTLEPKSRADYTYVLQEYFIPVDSFNAFIPKMKKVYDEYDVNVVNVSIRHAHTDTLSYLSWAPQEMFAFVIYYRQSTDAAAQEQVRKWTREMTDAILSVNGTWYLPYQPHATKRQFKEAFAQCQRYFEVKNRVDSNHRFNNQLLNKYNPYLERKLKYHTDTIAHYTRGEEQTILTIPEWYLVFNPVEYANYLEKGNNPSDFPFYASIKEYWTTYNNSFALTEGNYPSNAEYKTMLDVIGFSMTAEFTAKMLYENTLGQVFSWFGEEEVSAGEKTIAEAHRAYADFIYQTAWYEFDFLPWIAKAWNADAENEYSKIRRFERLMIFTAEFTVKAGYAKLIELGAKSQYETPSEDIFVLIEQTDKVQSSENLRVYAQDSSNIILAIKRWGAFTEEMLRVKNDSLQIDNIAGNDEIVVAVIQPKDTQNYPSDAQLLYFSELVTESEKQRAIYFIPVTSLFKNLQYFEQQGWEVEHIYDY